MEQRLSLVTLGVRDLHRSVAFYEALGWRRSLRDVPGVAFFQLGGIGLSLYPVRELADDAGVQGDTSGGFRGVALAHNVRTKEDVDMVMDLMARSGGSVRRSPDDKVWGGYSGYVSDPDGHLWEVAWNPHFPLDASGNIQIPD